MIARFPILLLLLAAAPVFACESAPSEIVDWEHRWIADQLRTRYAQEATLPADLTLAKAGINPRELDHGIGDGANFGMVVESTEPPVVTLLFRHIADEQSRSRFMRVNLRTSESRENWLPEGEVQGRFDWEPDSKLVAHRNFRNWVYRNTGVVVASVFILLLMLVGAASLRVVNDSDYSVLERRWARMQVAAVAWITSLCVLSLVADKRGLAAVAAILGIGSVVAFFVLVYTAIRLKPRTKTLLAFQAAPWVVVAVIAMNWTMMTISCGGRPELGWALFWLIVGALVAISRWIAHRDR